MGFDMEMDDFHDSKEHKQKNKSYFLFKKNNMITCVGVPFRILVWNYFCWFLAGKPKMKEQEIK
tara:strand:- start:19 stop:210 length:192 start_codon:yes stop_codon:yes gene_type:complete